jgi:diketogulonate reductase-like aldo/keto reductase
MPTLIYGTAWKEQRTSDLVYQAIKSGFRGIDTAAQPRHYREDLVGVAIRRAIEEGLVQREELFVSPGRVCPLYAVPKAICGSADDNGDDGIS